METSLQISRSGRILKKSVKLMEYEESHSGEASIQEKFCQSTVVAKKKTVSSYRRQKAKCARKLFSKNSLRTSRAIRRNSSKATRISSLGSFSEVIHERENVVPPIKITKISYDGNKGEDPTYSVSPSSSKMLDVSDLLSHSLDWTEESSSDSTVVSSEFSGRDTSVSSTFGHASTVPDDISESMSDEESSDNSSSSHQLSNSDEEHYAERRNSIEAATNEEESSDDSSSMHQLSNSDEEHDVDRSNKTEAETDEDPDWNQSPGCPRRSVPSNDGIKSAVLKGKYSIGNDDNTAVITFQKKGDSRITSFMLWSKENRSKISAQHKHLSRKEVSTKVTETWKALDQKEKNLWQRKAKQLALKGSTAQYLKSKQGTKIAVETDPLVEDSNLENLLKCFPIGTAPIDTAAHLALLGNSLTNIGLRIAQLDYEPSKTGVYSTLLDSVLCAIGPLLCLTREIAGLEHLPGDNFQKILDHIAYFFPGL